MSRTQAKSARESVLGEADGAELVAGREPWEDQAEGIATATTPAEVVPASTAVHGGQVVGESAQPVPFDLARYGPAARNLIGYIAEKAKMTEDEDVVIAEQVAAQILGAETADDILDPFGTIKGQELLGRNLAVFGCRFLDTDFMQGFPWFVVADVEDPTTGKHFPVTMGGQRVVMQFAGLHRLGEWPQVMTLLRADKPTRKGFYPLRLERPRV